MFYILCGNAFVLVWHGVRSHLALPFHCVQVLQMTRPPSVCRFGDKLLGVRQDDTFRTPAIL